MLQSGTVTEGKCVYNSQNLLCLEGGRRPRALTCRKSASETFHGELRRTNPSAGAGKRDISTQIFKPSISAKKTLRYGVISWVARLRARLLVHTVVITPIGFKRNPAAAAALLGETGRVADETAILYRRRRHYIPIRCTSWAHIGSSGQTCSCESNTRLWMGIPSYLSGVDTCRRAENAGDHVLCRSDGAVLQLVCHCRLQFHMRSRLVRHATSRVPLALSRTARNTCKLASTERSVSLSTPVGVARSLSPPPLEAKKRAR